MLLGSIASIFCLPINMLAKSALLLLVVGYILWNLYQNLQWQGIGQDAEGWYLESAGEKINIAVAGDSTITPIVSILRFHLPGKRLKCACVIFKDAMSHDIYRQFTVRIKYFKKNM